MSERNDMRSGGPAFQSIRQLELAETFFEHSVACLVILDRDYNFIRVSGY
ncbi:hypothetical protein RBA41_03360 [Massilia sp. CCM 9210]|nr:hypothetical protein [Massilia sp. CCM 9210]MDQ1812333.1 hypothetical protein [Massilia sp. CCM 9210]